jgi:hypothetical protein
MALPTTVSSYSKALLSYLSEPDRWHRESEASVAAASIFTYDRYLGEIQGLVLGNC